MDIKAVKIINFKRSREVEILAPPLSVVVGGNNSGKSSLLQGIHFAITVLQSAKSSADGGKSMSTLGYDQFIYRPTGDLIGLHHGGPITSKVGPEFTFTFTDAGNADPQEFHLHLRRGKNANIAINFDSKSSFFTRAGDRTKPLSIFVPGLAGVPLREEKRTPSIVTNGIAQGDSNIYLRNVLLQILADRAKLERFHEIIHSIFPGLQISSSFKDEIHLYIEIMVQLDGANIPLEMVGTGCLQAIQLVAYVTAYDPALLLLDEPDAHLHPSNQRTLAATLQRITENGATKIILASHSRHIFDALTYNDRAQIVWLKNGVKQTDSDRSSLSILLDLGALDSFELLKKGGRKLTLLTEDTKISRLQVLLKANGLEDDEYLIQPLHGVNNLTAAAPIADFFTKQGDDTHVVVHRDGDCMTDDEKTWWAENEGKKLPDRTHLFITKYSDIEHMFCQPAHIAAVYGIPLAGARELVDGILVANNAQFLIEFAQKRSSLKDTALRKMPDVPSAADLVRERIAFEQVRGKSLFPFILTEIQKLGFNPMHLTTNSSEALVDPRLKAAVDALKRSAGPIPAVDTAPVIVPVVAASGGTRVEIPRRTVGSS